MGTSNFMIAMAGGVLAASNLIIAKLPRAKEYIDRITPYAGFIGVFMLIWGTYNLLSLPDLVSAIGALPVTAIAAIACVFLMVACGFVLGFGLVSKYVLSKNPVAEAKGERLRTKLAPLSGSLGLGLIACSMWLMLNTFVLKMAI
jgi:hypothetical protein